MKTKILLLMTTSIMILSCGDENVKTSKSINEPLIKIDAKLDTNFILIKNSKQVLATNYKDEVNTYKPLDKTYWEIKVSESKERDYFAINKLKSDFVNDTLYAERETVVYYKDSSTVRLKSSVDFLNFFERRGYSLEKERVIKYGKIYTIKKK